MDWDFPTTCEAKRQFLLDAVDRVREPVEAGIEAAETMAQPPMLSDRRSVLESRDLPLAQALQHEAALAAEAKRLETAAGARRFTEGEGRHGLSA
jgi:enoyl-CoA hydratase